MEMQTEYQLEDGKLLIFKRQNSRFWQMRARVDGSNTYIWRSLKTSDIEKAKSIARRELYKLEILQEAGQPLKQHFMRDIIKSYISDLDLKLEKKSVTIHMYRMHMTNVNVHIAPHFNDIAIQSIDGRKIEEFFNARVNDFDEIPSMVTIRTWSLTLKAILKHAVAKKLIKTIPTFQLPDGRSTERRACFTREEWATLLEKMNLWIVNGCDQFRYNRTLLVAYVEILGLTGMRTNDAINLRWKHITFFLQKRAHNWDELYEKYETPERRDAKFTSIIVSGKPHKNRKTRELTGQRHCTLVIERWRRTSKFKNDDDLVFCLEKDTPYRPDAKFKQMLTEFGMLNDSMGNPRTPYSIRHTYATTRLESGVPIHLLANQMGTSVQMIEKHYGHIQIRDHVDKLAQNRTP